MKFDKASAIGFVLGFFVLSPVFIMIAQGSLRWTFNHLINGIMGMAGAILFGFALGWIEGRLK